MTKRVLVTGAANIGKAGVATIVYKWGQEFNTDVVVYDYLMQSGLPEEKYQNAIKAKGGIIYTCENKQSMMGIIKWVQKIITDNKYETLHINSDSAYIAAAYIYAAKRGGIKDIYVHSHCSQIDETNSIKRVIKIILHKICRPYVCKNTKMFLACSTLAGEWMFGKRNIKSKRYRTIFNGVEVEQYLFDFKERVEKRNELGINDKYVIANIGRLSYQKNQEFLINVFEKYYSKHKNSVLVIVGEGELLKKLRDQVEAKKLNQAIIFTGLRNDVPKLLSAFDVLVMPSRFEGLPVTMVEAQMSDLPCIVASTITREAQFTDNISYIDGWEESKWIEAIEKASTFERSLKPEEKINSHFNLENAAAQLQDILAK